MLFWISLYHLGVTHLQDLPKDSSRPDKDIEQQRAWDRVGLDSTRDLSPNLQTTDISPGVVQLPGVSHRSRCIGTGISSFNAALSWSRRVPLGLPVSVWSCWSSHYVCWDWVFIATSWGAFTYRAPLIRGTAWRWQTAFRSGGEAHYGKFT